ncbi:MAG: hypothetical protein US33_C0012G0014 [Parcubacteria group bacterium GW2011_GWC1_36_9]|nr:MAG: hypothetical protein US33_C0012G0014 [Parcubacteria group bacterium GW2011_GWC1_36_9]
MGELFAQSLNKKQQKRLAARKGKNMISIIIVVVLGAFVLQGLKRIPASPPHKGQATFLGKRTPGKVYEEGWGFFPFFPYLIGFILVKVERITFEILSEKTRTPDLAESQIPISLTFRPLSEKLIEYIDSGQEAGVRKQLEGAVRERIREWCMGTQEGPMDWKELNQSQLEAVSVLVRKIAGETLTPIKEYAQSVPTWIWLRYFSQPQPTKNFLVNEEDWAKDNWQKVREILKQIENSENGAQKIEELKTAVKERRANIEALRNGNGQINLPDLGIRLERLNLGDINVIGKVAEKAEEKAKEEQERQAEELELKFVRERIAEFMLPPFNYDKDKALEIVQTERGKVSRAIKDNRITTDTTTAEMIAAILGRKS